MLMIKHLGAKIVRNTKHKLFLSHKWKIPAAQDLIDEQIDYKITF